MQARPGRRAKSGDVSRVGRNFRFDEDDVHLNCPESVASCPLSGWQAGFPARLLFTFIKNFPQDQTVRGGGHARNAAVLAGEYSFDVPDGYLMLADLRQGPNNAPAHLVEKTVPFDDEGEERPASFDVATVEGADGGFHFVIAGGGEGFEIVPAQKKTGGGAHRAEIQRTRHVPRLVAQQRIHRRMVPN